MSDTGELRRVQWASRRAREMQQRTAGELIDGYCSERRQPSRTLPQDAYATILWRTRHDSNVGPLPSEGNDRAHGTWLGPMIGH
jgi:hypothetical protein